MCSYINCTGHQILLELRKKGRWMAGLCIVHVTWGMCTGLSEILNHSERSFPLLRPYMYTKLQTSWHIHCCHGWLNSLPQGLLHSHCSNTINTSTVVMLGFSLCQFNTGLAWRLCLLLLTKFSLWFKFNIHSLGWGWWCLWFEFRRVSFVPV
jgi:hypothetical protein